jgi:hypothetical protein
MDAGLQTLQRWLLALQDPRTPAATRTTIEAEIVALKARADAWATALKILSSTTDQLCCFFAASVLEDLLKTRWEVCWKHVAFSGVLTRLFHHNPLYLVHIRVSRQLIGTN